MADRRYRIGCQSWGYDDWITPAAGETVFYPSGTKQSEMLELYAQVFDTIEVDSTAYGIPPLSSLEGWSAKTPAGFTFSLKVPSRITHEFSLDARSLPMMREFVHRVANLREKLGVILIQLPASFESNVENAKDLRAFLNSLPVDRRFAVEFRHPGWFVDWTYDELNERGIALALVEGKWVPRGVMFEAMEKIRTDFAYVRIMGLRDLEKFDRIYRDRTNELELWAEQIAVLNANERYIYIDNYFEGHAPATANRLKQMLGITPVLPAILESQQSLF
jgi:uncharacterized protein YecE (DUF72 family)